jgi:DNA-binding NtrC family response regulator
MAKVLLIGFLTDLLHQRTAMLRSAGHEVASAQNLDEALRTTQWGQYDVVVVGHGVPERLRRGLSNTVKRVNPATRVLMLCSSVLEKPGLADAWMDTTASLDDLQRTVEGLASTKARSS